MDEHATTVQVSVVVYLKGTATLGLHLTPLLGLVKVTAYSDTTTRTGRTRHVDMRLMCVREMVANAVVETLRISIHLNPGGDGHTKALTGQPFRDIRAIVCG
jgi:hypothetical protein